jgi:hypothetical protein
MRSIISFLGVSLAITGSACSDGGKPVGATKGNATIVFDNCVYADTVISGSEGAPTLTNYGGPVSRGGGFDVSCKLSGSGTSYSILAHLESAAASLDVQSNDVSAGVSMIFFESGTQGTPEPVHSANASNDTAPTCTLTTSREETLLTIGSGTIFAAYDCPKVVAASNTSSVCHTSGLFYFTGCSG